MTNQSGIIHSIKLLSGDDPHGVLEELFGRLGGLSDRVSSGDMVLIKPNFVAPFHKATTDLRFIDFFVTKIRQAGAVPVIGESSGFEFDTGATFDILGIKKFAAEKRVELINFEEKDYTKIDLDDIGTVEVAKASLEAGFIINLPVLKGHSITKVSGAVKNLFGFLSKPSRRSLHCRRLGKGIAALARRFDNTIHIVDARYLLTRAVFGESRSLDYCLAGLDPFTLDHYGSKLIGVNPGAVEYLEGSGEYTVEGEIPDVLPASHDRASLPERFHRMMYSAFYRLDSLKCSLFGGDSIIPSLHWHLGVHPEIGEITTEELHYLASLCEMDAISVNEGKILKEKCIKVRCLKCYHEAKPGKIVLKGLNSPKGSIKNE
jgi:uncharacterized protein (DUF362 family)